MAEDDIRYPWVDDIEGGHQVKVGGVEGGQRLRVGCNAVVIGQLFFSGMVIVSWVIFGDGLFLGDVGWPRVAYWVGLGDLGCTMMGVMTKASMYGLGI